MSSITCNWRYWCIGSLSSPYSPYLNPAKKVFSKIKYLLQQNDEVIEGATEEEFDDFILQGFVPSQRMIAMVTLSMQDTHDAVI